MVHPAFVLHRREQPYFCLNCNLTGSLDLTMHIILRVVPPQQMPSWVNQISLPAAGAQRIPRLPLPTVVQLTTRGICTFPIGRITESFVSTTPAAWQAVRQL